MTDQSFLITPPDALRAQWRTEAPIYRDFGVGREEWLIDRAAQWGADQELEACYEWLVNKLTFREDGIRFADELRAARRPRPPSLKELKERALKRLKALEKLVKACGHSLDDTIRLALEALPND
jgi:hypothetical protein